MISLGGLPRLALRLFSAGCLLLIAEYVIAVGGAEGEQVLQGSTAVKHDKLRSLGATIREPLGQQASVAGYLIIENTGASADSLTLVSSPQFERIEIHEHTHADGMMRMRQVASVQIAAAQTLDFKTSGLHLMLFNPKGLKRGAKVQLELTFASGVVLPVVAEVVSVGTMH